VPVNKRDKFFYFSKARNKKVAHLMLSGQKEYRILDPKSAIQNLKSKIETDCFPPKRREKKPESRI
jgi:hypothetical protein